MKFKKLLSVMLAVMMVMSVMPASTIIASADTTIPEGATLIFAEDFESGYTTDTDLLADGTVNIQKDDKNVLKLVNSKNLADDVASVKVVDGSALGFTGKALEVKNADTNKANTVEVYFNFDSVDVTNSASPYYGKQIVVEYDAVIEGFGENKFMGISTGTAKGFQRASVASLIVSNGAYTSNNSDPVKRNWWSRPTSNINNNPEENAMMATLNLSTKKHIKYVFEQSAAVDTVRTYGDGNTLIKDDFGYAIEGDSNYGKVLKDYVGETYQGADTFDFGAISYLYTKLYSRNASAVGSFYVDNIKVYAVNPITFDGLTADTNINPTKGVEVNFSEAFEATEDTFAVSLASDATNAKIGDAITDVVMADDNKSAIIKMDFSVLAPQETYNIWVDDEFVSLAGAIYYKDHSGINEANEWQLLGGFTTCEKFEIASISESIEEYVEGEDGIVEIVFSSALNEAVDVGNAFNVVDEEGREIRGLVATKVADNTIELDLSGLKLGEGTHTITSVEDAIFNAAGISAAVTYSFTAAPFAVSAIPASGTIEGYEGGERCVELNFTRALEADEADLAEVFVVTDTEGNVKTGLNPYYADNSKKNVVFDLADINLGRGTHTITATVVSAGGAECPVSYEFGILDFEAKATPEKLTQYVPGTKLNVEIALTIPTVLDASNIANGVVIADETGTPVPGLTVEINDAKNLIKAKFETAELIIGEKYTLKTTSALVDATGKQLATPIEIPFKAVDKIFEAEILFEDSFGGIPTDTNLLEEDGSAIYGAYKFTQPAGSTEGYSAKIVDGSSLGFDGNVLEIRNSVQPPSGNDTSNNLKFFVDINGGTDIDTQSEDSPYYGKQIVYEFDALTSNLRERQFMKIDATATGDLNPFQKATGTSWALRNGEWNGEWNISTSLNMASKTRFKVVFDQTGAVDLVRTYADGIIGTVDRVSSTATVGGRFNGKVVKDFVGEHYKGQEEVNMSAPKQLYSYIAPSAGKEAIAYIDNIRVYVVDSIDFADKDNLLDFGTANKDAFNPARGFTVAFTQRINADTLKKSIKITKAADNSPVSSSVIKKITLAGDGKSALVQLDFNAMDQYTEYKVWLDDEFVSDAGALMFTNPLGVAPEDELIELGSFTTGEKLEVLVDKAVISNYDQGKAQEINITLSSALAEEVDVNSIFVVKDGYGEEVEGLEVSISEDRKIITLKLEGLLLGDGIHSIETVEGALINEAGVEGSAFITVHTIDFASITTPDSNLIRNYVEGTEQLIFVDLTTKANLPAGDISHLFKVTDAEGSVIPGIKATLSDDQMAITLDISGLKLGLGDHKITTLPGLKDVRGRELAFGEYLFSIMPFTAGYPAEVAEYVPGTEDAIEINLSYPLNAETVANISNLFTIRNKFGSAVSGLVTTVSDDNKTIALNLAGLDIAGGVYDIASKPGALVSIKGEVLADIAIILSTSVVEDDEGIAVDNGVGPNPGEEAGEYVATVLLDENFNSEDYNRDVNWLKNNTFVDSKFKINKYGNADGFVDSYVSIVQDPLDPTNYVLKNVAGFKDATGSPISGPSNYHIVTRELDGGDAIVDKTDAHTVIKMSTKVFIPEGGAAGAPTGNNDLTGDTKNDATIIALTNNGTKALNHPNLRQSSGVAAYSSWVNKGESARPNSTSSGAAVTGALKEGEWNTIELIFGYNKKDDNTYFNSYEVVVNGTKATALGGYYSKETDYSTINGMMSKLVTATAGSGTTTVLYDDWKIVKMNRLETQVNVTKENVEETKDIVLTVTGKLTEDSAKLIEDYDLVSLKDAEGTDVPATIVVDNSGVNTKIMVTPVYGLKYSSDYVVAIEKEYVNNKGIVTPIIDETGTTFGGLSYAFTTAKAYGNSIDADASASTLSYNTEYMKDATEFNYTIKLAAPATSKIIAAVATFSEDNELLGITYKNIDVAADSADFKVNSQLGTKALRLYIWEANPDGSMGRLMQLPDEVTSR